jgi:lipoate-protein ligase A
MAHQTPTVPQWTLIIDADGRSGAEHMATDQALLDNAAHIGTATLRLYRWDPPCLSFGRNEAAAQHYDRAQIERLGIDVVRRPTGGRAVWHEHEVTYAVAAPIEIFGSLREAYLKIHERIAVALRSLGVDASIATRLPAYPPARPGSCFSTAVGGEIVAGGRKLVGSAQVRRGGALLQHGSILLGGSQEMIRAVSRQPSAVSGATTLSTVLSQPVTFDEVAEAVVAAFADRLTAASPDRPTAASSGRLTATLPFRDPAWTWRR